MKKILLTLLITVVSGILFTNLAKASSLDCFQVDGMSVFGYDGSEWVHIGGIGNEFSSYSIANEFGAGNEFKSTSIFNEFGRYGSEFSSTSAFNNFASNPPIIVSDDYKFIGYLTINTTKFPYINTYEAIACAKKSFRSPSGSMTDITFKSIPGIGSSNYYGYSSPNTCPANSHTSSTDPTQCSCDTGYQADVSKTTCVLVPIKTNDQVCQDSFGVNVVWDGTKAANGGVNCNCKSGYMWASDRTQCVPTPTCLDGYVLNSSNSCVTYTQSCQEVNHNDPNIIGEKGENGNTKCICKLGYIWNGTSCIVPVVTTTVPVVIKKSTPFPKTEAIKESLKVEAVAGSQPPVITTNEDIQTPPTTTTEVVEEPTQKIPWYKKVWRFFFGFKK